jgi:hypothetical protein
VALDYYGVHLADGTRSSLLVALAQQGAETVNYITAQRSIDNPRGEPSVDNRSNDRAKQARSEEASSLSDNYRLIDNDMRRSITLNRQLWECGSDRDNLLNIINDRRHLRARSPTPPWCSPVRDVIPSGRDGFCALAPTLRQVVWPEKFKAGHIKKYDCHTPFRERGNEASIRVPRMFKSHAWQQLINRCNVINKRVIFLT